jgi:uncharacterized protein YbjT (DUF2867 family)
MKEQKILVTGGTGKTGRRIIERLQRAGHKNVRVGSRSHQPVFDWENAATWEGALSGVDAVYIAYQPDLCVPGTSEVLNAFASLASKQGVKKMVLLSGRGEDEALLCEEKVKAHAENWTIVRASWFNQNFSEGFFLETVRSGHVALPRATTLEPFTDADDIADVVVKVLLDDEYNGQTLELTGPRLLTFEQAVGEIAVATGRSIAFEPLSLEQYVDMLRAYKVPEDHIWLANYLFTEVLDGRNASVTTDIQRVLGRPARDFSAYAADVAKRGVWTVAQLSSI